MSVKRMVGNLRKAALYCGLATTLALSILPVQAQELDKYEALKDIDWMITDYNFDVTIRNGNGYPDVARFVHVLDATDPSQVFSYLTDVMQKTDANGNVTVGVVHPFTGRGFHTQGFVPNHVSLSVVYFGSNNDTHLSWLTLGFATVDGINWKPRVEKITCPINMPHKIEHCTREPRPDSLISFNISKGGKQMNSLVHGVTGAAYLPYNEIVSRAPSITVQVDLKLPKD